MNRRMIYVLFECLVGLALSASSANAHMVWLDTIDDAGQTRAVLFFSEGPSERDYHLPESLANVQIFARNAGGERLPVPMEKKEAEGFIGLRSTEDLKGTVALEATCEYGIYHGNKLVYYAKHLPAASADALAQIGPSQELKLEIVPRITAKGVTLTILWDGKPAKDVTVTFSDPDGVPTELTTRESGEATFELSDPGLVSVVANRTDDKEKGQIDGTKYHAGMHFATLTFQFDPAGK